MHKVVTLLALLCFLWAQTATALHAAEHGHAEHEHEGKLCELYVFTKHNDAVTSSEVSAQLYFAVKRVKQGLYYRSPATSSPSSHNPSRGPPSYLS